LLKNGYSLATALEGDGPEIQDALEELKDFLFELVVVETHNWDDTIALRRKKLDIKLEYAEDVIKKFHKYCGWDYLQMVNGNLQEVEKMLKEDGFELLNQLYGDNSTGYCRYTPLTTAAAAAHDDIVSFLLQLGADVDAKGGTIGTAAIHCATGEGEFQNQGDNAKK
jgi:ankyrin repeat protein